MHALKTYQPILLNCHEYEAQELDFIHRLTGSLLVSSWTSVLIAICSLLVLFAPRQEEMTFKLGVKLGLRRKISINQRENLESFNQSP